MSLRPGCNDDFLSESAHPTPVTSTLNPPAILVACARHSHIGYSSRVHIRRPAAALLFGAWSTALDGGFRCI